MSVAVFVIFCVLISTETFFICAGNAFTIFVFWKKRLSLQRTSYLLLNLAVVDLLVGVMELISLATRWAPYLFPAENQDDDAMHFSWPWFLSSLVVLLSSSSVISLAIISMERVYAVLWPLRHRTLNTNVYLGGIFFVWAGGIFAGVLFNLRVLRVVDSVPATLAINIPFLFALFAVGASYIVIRNRLRRTLPIFESQNRKNVERNIKLSKTLFIVIGASLICWLPSTLLYIVVRLCPNCISYPVERLIMLIVTVLHLANSVVNPVLYSYRMPMFKEALRKLFRIQGHRENEQLQLDRF